MPETLHPRLALYSSIGISTLDTTQPQITSESYNAVVQNAAVPRTRIIARLAANKSLVVFSRCPSLYPHREQRFVGQVLGLPRQSWAPVTTPGDKEISSG